MSNLRELLELETDSMVITDCLVQFVDVDNREYIMEKIDKDGHPCIKVVIHFDNEMAAQYGDLYDSIINIVGDDVMYQVSYQSGTQPKNLIKITMLSCVPEYKWLKEIQEIEK